MLNYREGKRIHEISYFSQELAAEGKYYIETEDK